MDREIAVDDLSEDREEEKDMDEVHTIQDVTNDIEESNGQDPRDIISSYDGENLLEIGDEEDEDDDENEDERRHSRFVSERFNCPSNSKLDIDNRRQNDTQAIPDSLDSVVVKNEMQIMHKPLSKRYKNRDDRIMSNMNNVRIKKPFNIRANLRRLYGSNSLATILQQATSLNRFSASMTMNSLHNVNRLPNRGPFSSTITGQYPFMGTKNFHNGQNFRPPRFPHGPRMGTHQISCFTDVPSSNGTFPRDPLMGSTIDQMMRLRDGTDDDPEIIEPDSAIVGPPYVPNRAANWESGPRMQMIQQVQSISNNQHQFNRFHPPSSNLGIRPGPQFIGELNQAVFGPSVSSITASFPHLMVAQRSPYLNAPPTESPRQAMRSSDCQILRAHFPSSFGALVRHQPPLRTRKNPRNQSYNPNDPISILIASRGGDLGETSTSSPDRSFNSSHSRQTLSNSKNRTLNNNNNNNNAPSTNLMGRYDFSWPNAPSTANQSNIRSIRTVNAPSVPRSRSVNFIRNQKRSLPDDTPNNRTMKPIEVVDLESSKKSQEPGQSGEEQSSTKDTPMIVDLEIDEEYIRRLENQKKLREEIIRKKEEGRRQRVAALMKKDELNSSSSSVTTLDFTPNPMRTVIESVTELEKPSTSCDPLLNRLETDSPKPSTSGVNLKPDLIILDDDSSKNSNTSPNCNVTNSQEPRTLEITGLAPDTTKATISKLCRTIGPVESCSIDSSGSQQKAIVTFESSKDAYTFRDKYQRHLVDLCVIQVSFLR
ncbi:uncharacterized protein LOC141856249 [Brevipalpus obovatus]|uniref:uncharacterized protein LOC141856249 n=1 Tax=Brevipalpus obovatus TaxID=246614 RepID=UPI003D9F625E